MLTIRIMGGLGNQMFQYAFVRSQSLKYNIDFNLCIDYYNYNGDGRIFLLDKYNIKGNIIDHIEKPAIFKEMIQFKKEYQDIYDGYIIGNFQNEKYFKKNINIIKEELTLKSPIHNNRLLQDIDETNSIAVHIRRGDYFNNKSTIMHAVDLSSYYDKSFSLINSIVENPVFFFFSDDIEWVKNNIYVKGKSVYVSGGEFKDYEELFLISKCKNHIISNSTYGWWGTYLSNNYGIKIAPKIWFTDKDMQGAALDITPYEWLRL